MKKFFFPVVLVMSAAIAMAQTPTTSGSTTTTNAPQPDGTISPAGTAVYNRDTASTTDTMTTSTSATTTTNQSGNAAGAATRSTTDRAAGATTGTIDSTTGNAAGTAAAGSGTTGATATLKTDATATLKTDAVATLNDNQITGVLITINDAGMESAKLALRRARLAEVKDFARKMSDDHKGNMADTKNMYRKYNKSSARSDVGVSLQSEAKDLRSELTKSTRDGFDKAYIDQQVILHEKALATLNETLLPNVTDETLKTHLEKTRTAVTEHLNEARAIQTKIQ